MTAPFRSARDIIIRTPALSEAEAFYTSVFGFRTASRTDHLVGFDTGAFTLYVERGASHGPVFEYLVPDVAAAKARLLSAGCVLMEEDLTLPRCYLRDPYGMVFNVGKATGG